MYCIHIKNEKINQLFLQEEKIILSMIYNKSGYNNIIESISDYLAR